MVVYEDGAVLVQQERLRNHGRDERAEPVTEMHRLKLNVIHGVIKTDGRKNISEFIRAEGAQIRVHLNGVKQFISPVGA